LTVGIVAWVARANPYLHVREIFEPIERLSRRYPMPNVRAVTTTHLAGAMRLPLHRTVRVEDVRTPGDAREYRYGVHQGTDFYGVRKGTPVYPVASGIILRVDWFYTPMPRAVRETLLERCREVGGTPGSFGVTLDPTYGDILDRLRGRQVWVYHGRNANREPVLSIYGHLDSVERLPVGTFVTTRQALGTVGNTGTSMEGVSNSSEVHLHLEILVGANYWRVRRDDEIGVRLSTERERALREETLRAFGVPRGAVLPSAGDTGHIEARTQSENAQGGMAP
jgi:murein DD-endopeptidase MepM/ murein hydrolase activator NlpD